LLASKAKSIRRSQALAAWLHQTARHVALNFLRKETSRQKREIQTIKAAARGAPPNPLDELTVRELLAIFDEELQRLRTNYRLPLILCALQGHTMQEAAKQLGWTPQEVKGRLERGRAQLRQSLVRRGLSLSCAAIAFEASQGMLFAQQLPAGFTTSTLDSLAKFTAKKGIVEGTIYNQAIALAEESLRSIGLAKLKIAMMLLLGLGGIAAGLGSIAAEWQSATHGDSNQAAEKDKGPKTAAGPASSRGKQPAHVDRYGDPLPEGALTRLGTLRWRAPGEVRTLATAPDGKTVVVSFEDGLCLIDAATGKLIRQVDNIATSIVRIAFSPDGARFALGGSALVGNRIANIVQVREVRSGQRLQEFETEELQWLGWSADGQPLAILLKKGAVVLRELATEKVQRFESDDLPLPQFGLSAVAYTSGAKILAFRGAERVVHVWDAATGQKRCTLEAAEGSIRGLAISDDGRSLATLSRSNDRKPGTVQLWDLVTANATHTLAKDQRILLSVAFAPNGRTLATVGWLDVRLWDVATGRESNSAKGVDSFGKDVAFSADSKSLVTMENYSPAIHIWEVRDGVLKQESVGHSNGPEVLAFSSDGSRVASGGMEGSIIVWDTSTGVSLVQVPHRNQVLTSTFTDDGRFLYSRWLNDKLRFFDAASGLEARSLKLEDPESRPDAKQSELSLFLSNDQKTLVGFSALEAPTEGHRLNREVLVRGWDAISGALLSRRKRANSDFGRAVSPDLKLLAVSQPEGHPRMAKMKGGQGREPILIEDLVTGRRRLNLPELGGQANPMAFSPDGRLLASNNSGPTGVTHTLRLWELATAREILALPTTLNSRIAFSSDMRLLAMLSSEREILLWDLRAGKELRRIKDLDAHVVSLAVSPDGRRLVTGMSDSTLLVWDVTGLSKRP
jgi:RNA polymerase sigma factor (sigma-70 family)